MIKIDVSGDRGEFAGTITRAGITKVFSKVPNPICIIFDTCGEFVSIQHNLERDSPSIPSDYYKFNRIKLNEYYMENLISSLSSFGRNLILLECWDILPDNENMELMKLEIFLKELQLKINRNIYLFINKTK